MWCKLSTIVAVITEVPQWGTLSCSRPQPATDIGFRDGRSNWLISPPTFMGSTPWAPHIARCKPGLQISRLVAATGERTLVLRHAQNLYTNWSWCIVRIIGTSLPTMHSVWRHHVHSVAAVLVLYSVISVSYFNYLMMASETPRVCAMFGYKFIHGVMKCYQSFSKGSILTNIWLKKCRRSDGVNPNTARICSLYFSYPLKYVLFNLVTPLMWNINPQ